MEPAFPLTASPLWLFGVLLVFIGVFHVLFLYVWKLGRVGWKRVDYLWLGITALGVLGAGTDVRRFIAANTEELRAADYELRYSGLRDHVELLSGIAVCRGFDLEAHTTGDTLQDQYAQLCRFAAQLSARLPVTAPKQLDPAWLSGRPAVTDPLLLDAYADLDEDIQQAIDAQAALAAVVQAKAYTPQETAFSVTWPMFLACALALRITKVSGELSLGAQ